MQIIRRKPMNKKRQKIWDKSGGKCWYCGCELPEKGWHADHFEPIQRNWWTNTSLHPERDTEDNKVPCCAPCNILKGSNTLEGFRYQIEQFVNSLNLYVNQYKFAKKFGLLTETQQEVKFWFEMNLVLPEAPEATESAKQSEAV
jgi:5-methylcytosine-specific restriction endonuclease McrA